MKPRPYRGPWSPLMTSRSRLGSVTRDRVDEAGVHVARDGADAVEAAAASERRKATPAAPSSLRDDVERTEAARLGLRVVSPILSSCPVMLDGRAVRGLEQARRRLPVMSGSSRDAH